MLLARPSNVSGSELVAVVLAIELVQMSSTFLHRMVRSFLHTLVSRFLHRMVSTFLLYPVSRFFTSQFLPAGTGQGASAGRIPRGKSNTWHGAGSGPALQW